MIKKLIQWLFQPPVDPDATAFRTESGRLCPHMNMSDDDLNDFESWVDSL